MFKLIKLLGSFVGKMYTVEAKRLNKSAKVNADVAIKLAKRADEARDKSFKDSAEAAKVISQAQAIDKLFA